MKQKVAFALLMGIITTGIISVVLTGLNTNYTGSSFLKVWVKSWGVAYLIVIPCILLISPFIERAINKILK